MLEISSSGISSPFFGIYIFSPSSKIYAKLTELRSASSVSPPAASIASFILLPDFKLTMVLFFTQPDTWTIMSVVSSLSMVLEIFESTISSFSSVIVDSKLYFDTVE